MPVYYLDTSAIVKRYRNEPGTEAIDRLFDEPQADTKFYTSFLRKCHAEPARLRRAKYLGWGVTPRFPRSLAPLGMTTGGPFSLAVVPHVMGHGRFPTTLELTSSILRLAKGGQLGRSVADSMLARFRQESLETIRVLPLTDAIVNDAVAAVEQHQLRFADAIHLATAATIFKLAPDSETILVPSDRELLEAAMGSGMGVLNPQDAAA